MVAATKKFRKTLLQVGTHRSPDAEIVVTPERLRHWQDTFNKMSANGQVIPAHYDHSNERENLVPIPASEFNARKKRSARNSVGKMTGFQVRPDGKAAEITFETLTKDATEKFDTNAVYVSPVIFDKWTDGGGNKYSDAITHLDFVDHPVDHNQTPAEPVEDEPALVCCAVRMANGMPAQRIEEEVEDEIEDAVDEVEEQIEDEIEQAEENEVEPSASDDMGTLIDNLASFNIIIPEDTTNENVVERLNIALATARALEQDDNEMADQQPTNETPVVVQEPSNVRMSAYAERMHRDNLRSQLEGLRDSGRMTPAEFTERETQLDAVRLSLTDEGEPVSGPIEAFIEARKDVPEGTFFDTEQRTRMSIDPAGHPKPPSAGQGEEMSADDQEKLVDRMTRKRR